MVFRIVMDCRISVAAWISGFAIAFLGGAPVSAQDVVKVYVLAGQSNAVGAALEEYELEAGLNPQNDVLFWYEMGPSTSICNPAFRIESGNWIALQAQPDNGSGTFAIDSGFGAEIMLGRLLQDSRTDDVAIVKFALPRTTLADEWNAPAGKLYVELIAVVQQALAALGQMGHTTELAGFFWMQGESDAREISSASQYEDNLTQLIASLRNDLGVLDLPVVIGRVHSVLNFFGNYPFVDVVRTAQLNVADSDPFAIMVDTDGFLLENDFVHFNSQGLLQLGQALAESWVELTGPVPRILFDPSPGEPATNNVYTAIGNIPNRKVFFVFGLAQGSFTFGLCPGLSIDIDDPRNGGEIRANGVGIATLTIRVPAGASGRTVLTQIIDSRNCEKSNLLQFTFP